MTSSTKETQVSPLFCSTFSEAKYQLSLKARTAQKCGILLAKVRTSTRGLHGQLYPCSSLLSFQSRRLGGRTKPQMPTAPTFITHSYTGLPPSLSFSLFPHFCFLESPNKQPVLNSLLQALLSGELN